jgi:RimJ/RimL family protein N-acetyltransferase
MWRDADVAELTRIYSDPRVMRYLSPAPREVAERQVAEFRRGWEEDGFSLWAVEDRATGNFIGRLGLLRRPDWPLEPGVVEVGWVLDVPTWGLGLATEGGRAGLEFGFERLGLDRIISIARMGNAASRRVMEKLGLTHGGEAGWRGQQVVWYEIDRATWENSLGQTDEGRLPG